MQNKKYKILIIRTHRIGDILQVTPMIRGLREKYPEAEISILVAEGFQEVVRNNPDIDEVIPFSRLSYSDTVEMAERLPWGVYREIRGLVRELKERKYDLVINRQFTDAEAILACLIEPAEVRGKVMGSEGRYIYADPVTAGVVEKTLKLGRNPGLKNLADLSIDVAGAVPQERRLIFSVGKEAEERCLQRFIDYGLTDRDRIFGIQVGASRSFKKLGSPSIAAVTDYLVQDLGYKVLFFGSRGERPLGEEVLSKVQSDSRSVMNLMGETTLEELGGFLRLCDFLVTGDTGTMHVAAAMGTRTISTSYGMTYPYETAPYGPEHLILYSDLPCAPCDDPDLCSQQLACEHILRSEILISGIQTAIALARGEEGQVREKLEEPHLQGLRFLYTGKEPLKGDLRLYDLREGIPSLQGGEPVSETVSSEVREDFDAEVQEKLSGLLSLIRQISEQMDAGVKAFAGGEKVEGFQAILPVFDLWNRLLREATEVQAGAGPPEREHVRRMVKIHERLLLILQRMTQAMEQMDLSTLQDVLSSEMAPLISDEEKVVREWLELLKSF